MKETFRSVDTLGWECFRGITSMRGINAELCAKTPTYVEDLGSKSKICELQHNFAVNLLN